MTYLFNPKYVKITGTLPSAIFLSCLVHLLKNVPNVAVNDKTMMNLTGLQRNQFNAAKKRLRSLPFVNVGITRSFPPVAFYSINYDELETALNDVS